MKLKLNGFFKWFCGQSRLVSYMDDNNILEKECKLLMNSTFEFFRENIIERLDNYQDLNPDQMPTRFEMEEWLKEIKK